MDILYFGGKLRTVSSVPFGKIYWLLPETTLTEFCLWNKQKLNGESDRRYGTVELGFLKLRWCCSGSVIGWLVLTRDKLLGYKCRANGDGLIGVLLRACCCVFDLMLNWQGWCCWMFLLYRNHKLGVQNRILDWICEHMWRNCGWTYSGTLTSEGWVVITEWPGSRHMGWLATGDNVSEVAGNLLEVEGVSLPMQKQWQAGRRLCHSLEVWSKFWHYSHLSIHPYKSLLGGVPWPWWCCLSNKK